MSATITVHMLAFAAKGDKTQVRLVEIPIDTNQDLSSYEGEELWSVLGMAFEYGQNEFQPRQMPSVSVGDVVELGGRRFFMVMPMGFKEISKKAYRSLKAPTADHAYQLGFKMEV